MLMMKRMQRRRRKTKMSLGDNNEILAHFHRSLFSPLHLHVDLFYRLVGRIIEIEVLPLEQLRCDNQYLISLQTADPSKMQPHFQRVAVWSSSSTTSTMLFSQGRR